MARKRKSRAMKVESGPKCQNCWKNRAVKLIQVGGQRKRWKCQTCIDSRAAHIRALKAGKDEGYVRVGQHD